MTHTIYLMNGARAWVKRKGRPDEVVQIVLNLKNKTTGLCYDMYTAYEANPDHLGRILFDGEGYWIYDGEVLSVDEQEQLANFIINYVERL